MSAQIEQADQLFIEESAENSEVDEDHLQRDLDQDDNINDLEEDLSYNDMLVKKDIMISLQGLGSVKRINKNGLEIEAYIKGKHCQESLKILCKLLKNQRPQWPTARLTLAKFNVIQSDLMELMLTQLQDKKLSFWIVALMSMITMQPSDSAASDDKQIILKANRQYKKSFLRRQCLHTLVVHLSDYFRCEKIVDAQQQMFEAILVTIRNLLQIQNGDEQFLHEYFLLNVIRQDVFDMILYLLQVKPDRLAGKMSLVIMEIVYNSFCCFDPSKIFSQSIQIASMAQKMRSQKFKNIPCRSSRFMPSFERNSKLGVKQIFHSLDKKYKNQTRPQQQLRPFRNAQNKKVKTIKRPYVPQNILVMTVEGSKSTMKECLTKYCIQFMQSSVNALIGLVFNIIYRDDIRVFDCHRIQYMLFCSWAIEMTLNKYKKRKSEVTTAKQRGELSLSLQDIASIMQIDHFQLIYKTMYKEISREKKKDFKINVYHSSLILLKQYLAILNQMVLSFSDFDRKNASALLGNLFRHDVSKILKLGFYLTFHFQILERLVIVTNLFFKLLHDYSGGKVLTAKTNRVLKKKKTKKGKDQNQRNQQIEYQQPQQQDNPIFQERKYNQKSQFSYLAEYAIIKKHLTFLQGGAFLSNSQQLNNAIFEFLNKIGELLDASWLFYQADIMIIFQQILSEKSFALKYNKQLQFMWQSVRSFVKLVRKNPLAIVESLFRYGSIQIKNNILQNYSKDDGEDNNIGTNEVNLFND